MNLPRKEPQAYTQAPPEVPENNVKLLDALFERAISECARAVACISANDAEGKGAAINKVVQIVEALDMALDHKVAPALCAHLESLYLYIQDRLEVANIQFDAAPIVESEKILCTLREAFADAAKACTA